MQPAAVDIRVSRPDDAAVLPLLAQLDAYLYRQYPVAEFPQDVNHILSPAQLLNPAVTFLAAWQGEEAVGCAAVRDMRDQSGVYGEIKRMFVAPQARGQRVGEQLLAALEAHLVTAGIQLARLETGTRQPESLRLYQRCGYRPCGRFGDYLPNPVSVYLEKAL